MANHYDTCWHHNEETRNQHMIDWYASRANLDLEVPLLDKHVRLYNIDIEAAQKLLNDYDVDKKFIAVHSTSLVGAKDWPITSFETLIKRIVNELNLQVVQIGGKTDKPIPGAIGLLGLTSVPMLAGIIKLATAYVGVDSGPSYVAEAFNKPAFLIMGATMALPQEPDQKGPFCGPSPDTGSPVFYIEPERPKNSMCQPGTCYTHCALGTPCINTVSVEKVFNTIKDNLGEL
jgi:ADP-heptose:LPS heptosyltransferase